MAADVKKGFPPVPRLTSKPLFRFLASMRNGLLEMQRLSKFFSALSDQQQANLLVSLSRLTAAETKISTQVQSVQGMQAAIIELDQQVQQLLQLNNDQAGLINQLQLDLGDHAQQLSDLTGRLNVLENA